MRLAPDEHVVAAWAQPANGPGWSNSPVVVLICRNGTQEFRREYIQPEEQSAEMVALYRVCSSAHAAMTAAVGRMAVEGE
jgi:hypothetical protein